MPTPDSARAHDAFRPDIEGMRGLAVAVVVLFHAGLPGVIGGFVGVDVFFVISGFLITGLLLREHERTGRIGLPQFYARRVRRLLPAAGVVLGLTLVVALNVVAPLDRPSVGLDGAAAALSIGNIRFAVAAGDYFSSVGTQSPFLHFWSLAVEEQFYLVWPALILLAARGAHARRRVGVVVACLTIASFAANIFLTDTAANWAFYSLPTRAWELGLGGMLAVGAVVIARIPGSLVGLAGWLGFGAIVVAATTFDSSSAYPGMAALLPSVGAVALLAGGSRRLGPGRLLSLGPLRFLGKISYSLYLVHWPIFVLAPVVIGAELDEIAMWGLVGLSVTVASISWALVETPFRSGRPRFAVRPARTLSVGLAVVLAVVAVAVGPSLGVQPDSAIAATEIVTSGSTDPVDEAWVDGATSDIGRSVATGTGAPTVAVIALPTGPAGPTTTSPPTAAAVDIVNQGRLPETVKPTLAKARGDEERLRADHCLAFEDITKPAKCVYGVKDSTFTIALVGDSHAAAWFPALERLAKHEGWRLMTFVKVSCPFIDMRVRNSLLKREYHECADFNEATVARLTTLEPDLTLVSMSRIAIHPFDPRNDTVAAKGAAVARMLAKVPGRTALIVDTPSAHRDVPACLSAHTDDVEACAIPRSTAFRDSLGEVEQIAADASGAGRIDLTHRICIGDGSCPVVVNGLIIYRDKEHMTATFSRSLAPALGEAILADRTRVIR